MKRFYTICAILMCILLYLTILFLEQKVEIRLLKQEKSVLEFRIKDIQSTCHMYEMEIEELINLGE